jgi:zinc protease
VGDLNVDAVRAALQQGFADWAGGVEHVRVPNPLVPRPAQRLILETPDKQNATMAIQFSLPLSDNDPDYPALMLANHLLGGGGSSRLWSRVRESEGLSYDVRSGIGWSPFEPHSEWTASAIFAPQNRDKVEAAVREEIARALQGGFTAAELAQGQRGLLSFRQLGRAQDAGLAAALASNLYIGRTFLRSAEVDAAIAALTLDQVNAALRKYLQPDRFVSGYAGDFKSGN